jgi:hypothetical protein
MSVPDFEVDCLASITWTGRTTHAQLAHRTSEDIDHFIIVIIDLHLQIHAFPRVPNLAQVGTLASLG